MGRNQKKTEKRKRKQAASSNNPSHRSDKMADRSDSDTKLKQAYYNTLDQSNVSVLSTAHTTLWSITMIPIHTL